MCNRCCGSISQYSLRRWVGSNAESIRSTRGKDVLIESFIELAECVLKDNVYKRNTSFYKQIRGTAIGTKMAPPYAIIFMGDLMEKLLKDCDKKLLAWWRYVDDIFVMAARRKRN